MYQTPYQLPYIYPPFHPTPHHLSDEDNKNPSPNLYERYVNHIEDYLLNGTSNIEHNARIIRVGKRCKNSGVEHIGDKNCNK